MTDHPTAPGGQETDGAARAFDTAVPVGGGRPCTSYSLRVNGVDRPVVDAWVGESLLYVLRERLGLAGAKDGCEQGECGACSVQVDGKLVAACLVPAALAADSDIRTVEGLASDGTASDVQQALAASGAVQCGYCVPGLAMAVHDLLQRNHHPSDVEARQALSGNLCRCTGYRGVLKAVHTVAEARAAAAAAPPPEPSAAPEQQHAAVPQPRRPQQPPTHGQQPPTHGQQPQPHGQQLQPQPQETPAADAPAYGGTPQGSFVDPVPTAPDGSSAAVPGPATAPGLDPLFGPLDAVLDAVTPPPGPGAGPQAPAGHGTYAPAPYGTGVYAEQQYGEGGYHPDPYRRTLGADTDPVPVLYTPDSQGAFDARRSRGPQYGAPPARPPQYAVPPAANAPYGVPPTGTPGYGVPQEGDPQYGMPPAPTPRYGVPQEGNPQYSAPPDPETPAYGTPAYGTRLPEDDLA